MRRLYQLGTLLRHLRVIGEVVARRERLLQDYALLLLLLLSGDGRHDRRVSRRRRTLLRPRERHVLAGLYVATTHRGDSYHARSYASGNRRRKCRRPARSDDSIRLGFYHLLRILHQKARLRGRVLPFRAR